MRCVLQCYGVTVSRTSRVSVSSRLVVVVPFHFFFFVFFSFFVEFPPASQHSSCLNESSVIREVHGRERHVGDEDSFLSRNMMIKAKTSS